MDVIKIMETFPTQEDCIAYLERLRWKPGSPECPQCESTHIKRRTEHAIGLSDATLATSADSPSK